MKKIKQEQFERLANFLQLKTDVLNTVNVINTCATLIIQGSTAAVNWTKID